jgi:hypothetical protein
MSLSPAVERWETPESTCPGVLVSSVTEDAT